MSRKSKDDLIRHFRRQLYTRWGIDYSPEQVEQLINNKIRDGESTPMGRNSNQKTVHRIELQRGEETVSVVVYYDKVRSSVVTVLADDMEPRIVYPT